MTLKEGLWTRSSFPAYESAPGLAVGTSSMSQAQPVGVAMALMEVAEAVVHHKAAPSKILISPPGLQSPVVLASADSPCLMLWNHLNQN